VSVVCCQVEVSGVYDELITRPENVEGEGGGFSLGTLEKYGIRIKSAHDTETEGLHQPCSCSHQNHYVHLNVIRRVQLCIDAGGNHFQHLL